MKFLIFSLIATILTFQINCASINDDYDLDLPPPCPDDSELDHCLQLYTQSFWDKYANAYGSEILGLPPLDPFVMNATKWSFKNQLFDFSFYTNNVKIYNMKETTIHKVEFRKNGSNRYSTEAICTDPEVIAEGDFKVNLKISELKLLHKGHFQLKGTKIRNYIKATGIMEERSNGNSYFKAEKINFKPEVKNIKFDIQRTNATEAELLIDNLVMDLFERYSRGLYKEFVAATRPIWEPILLDVTNGFLKNFPVKLAITF